VVPYRGTEHDDSSIYARLLALHDGIGTGHQTEETREGSNISSQRSENRVIAKLRVSPVRTTEVFDLGDHVHLP